MDTLAEVLNHSDDALRVKAIRELEQRLAVAATGRGGARKWPRRPRLHGRLHEVLRDRHGRRDVHGRAPPAGRHGQCPCPKLRGGEGVRVG